MHGITAYGAYVPYWRMQRSAIGSALGSGGGKGTRAVASFDEDATSMGVEAARLAMQSAPQGTVPDGVIFATSSPPYLDKTNATAIHAALDLPAHAYAFDSAGSVRSSFMAFASATFVPGPTLAVLADVRTGLPGGGDEREGGDGAVAFLFGEDQQIAVAVGAAHSTGEFLDRWRMPGEPASHVWEERFGEHVYVPLAEAAAADALKNAGLAIDEIDHVIVAGLQTRAVRQVAKRLGARPDALAPDLGTVIGNAGSAGWGIALAEVLDRAEPDQNVLVVALADGADAFVVRTTQAIVGYRQRRAATVAEQIASGRDDLAYNTFLTWRGFLDREPPRRPDPDAYYAPPALRTEGWKFGFVGSRCTACGFLHLPPGRVCNECGTVDQMTPVRLADTNATIATYTVDRLAYSLSPPTVAAVLDFDGGGRYTCELTDVDPATVAIGQRVELTFRRVATAKGIHNYFWKARPLRGGL
ncbi:MAG: hydroxymethylglutaryl-CoA synthase [Acidimicrobiaceae bacterium]